MFYEVLIVSLTFLSPFAFFSFSPLTYISKKIIKHFQCVRLAQLVVSLTFLPPWHHSVVSEGSSVFTVTIMMFFGFDSGLVLILLFPATPQWALAVFYAACLHSPVHTNTFSTSKCFFLASICTHVHTLWHAERSSQESNHHPERWSWLANDLSATSQWAATILDLRKTKIEPKWASEPIKSLGKCLMRSSLRPFFHRLL